MPDVDVDEDEVGFQDGPIRGVVKVKVQHLAIAAPVAAKVEQDALVGLPCGLEGSGDIGLGLRRIGIGVAAVRGGGRSFAGCQAQQSGQGEELGDFHGVGSLHNCSQSATSAGHSSIFLRRFLGRCIYSGVE